MTVNNIRDYMQPGRRAHLVGIGGVSMAPLAEVLHGAPPPALPMPPDAGATFPPPRRTWP